MTRLLSTLSDPVWWLAVVVVGIVINVVAALILRRLDRQIDNLSKTRRIRSERRRSARAQRVALLRNDQRFLYLTLFEELRYRSRATNFFLSGVFLLVLGGTTTLPPWVRPFCLMLGALAFAIGQLAVRQAANLLFEIIDSSGPVAEDRGSLDKLGQ
jgi:hypothetical protein